MCRFRRKRAGTARLSKLHITIKRAPCIGGLPSLNIKEIEGGNYEGGLLIVMRGLQ